MSRLFEKIAADKLALGVWIKGGPHLVATLAKAGFDFVRPDMMFSALDWKELDHILRSCEATNMTCCLRVPSNPWAGGATNLQVAVDAARAFSLGLPVVQVSIASAAQVAALVDVAKDWHRSGAGQYPGSSADFAAQHRRAEQDAMILPAIESRGAIDEIDAIMQIEGLRAVMISCTDFSKELGHPFDYDHPEVWREIDRIVGLAQKHGITVAANTGYAYNTAAKITDRVSALADHGVRIVLVQGAEFLLEVFSRNLLDQIRDRFGVA